MKIPAIDDFRLEPGPGYGPAWTLDPEGTTFTLRLPPGEIYDFFEDDPAPHEPSYQLALVVLARLEELTRQAVDYLGLVVDAGRKGMFGEPSLTLVQCDAREGRVKLEMSWDADIYSAWSVSFAWHGEPPGRASPFTMGFRSR